MKVLLDTCLSVQAVRQLQEAGHDVVWAGEWQSDPGDEAVLSLANEQERVLVTLDKDFGELGVLRRLPHHGIIRLLGFRASEQGMVCRRVLVAYGEELIKGAILAVEPGASEFVVSQNNLVPHRLPETGQDTRGVLHSGKCNGGFHGVGDYR